MMAQADEMSSTCQQKKKDVVDKQITDLCGKQLQN